MSMNLTVLSCEQLARYCLSLENCGVWSVGVEAGEFGDVSGGKEVGTWSGAARWVCYRDLNALNRVFAMLTNDSKQLVWLNLH